MTEFLPEDDALNAEMIYNRHDITFHGLGVYKYVFGDQSVYCHIDNSVARVGVFGRVMTERLVDEVVAKVFKKYSSVSVIMVNCMGVDYRNLLIPNYTWIIDLPNNLDELEARVGRKGRYNMRRAEQNLAKELGGNVEFQEYDNDVPEVLVEEYFAFKSQTHGKDYGLTAREYLDKYFITGGMRMSAAGETLAVLFYCENNKTVFLENISYAMARAKWSPGILIYYQFLKYMIEKRVKRVFLGGGNYAYKERFGSICCRVYSGRIYRSRFRTRAFSVLNKIRHWVIDRAHC